MIIKNFDDLQPSKLKIKYEQSKNNATVNGKPNTNVPDGGSTSSIAPISAGNKNGGQEVYHIHLHLMGGRKFLWPAG